MAFFSIRIVDAESLEQSTFPTLHALSIGIALMIMTLQMQTAVNHKMGVVGGERLALLSGLTSDDWRAQNEITDELGAD